MARNKAQYNYVARYYNKNTGEKINMYVEGCTNADDARERAHDMMCAHVEAQLAQMHVRGYVADAYMISESDAETLVNANWRCVACKRGGNVSTQGQTGKRRVRRSNSKCGEVRTTTMKEERAKRENSAA